MLERSAPQYIPVLGDPYLAIPPGELCALRAGLYLLGWAASYVLGDLCDIHSVLDGVHVLRIRRDQLCDEFIMKSKPFQTQK